jgi:phage shock protein A
MHDDDDDDDYDYDNGSTPPKRGGKHSHLHFNNHSSNVNVPPPRVVTPTGSVTTSSIQHYSRNHNNNNTNHKMPQQPHRAVKPRSWDELEGRVYPSGISNSRAGKTHGRISPFANNTVLVVSSTPSFTSSINDDDDDDDDERLFDEDMPMDERMDRKQQPAPSQQQQQQRSNLPYHSHSNDSDSRNSYRSVTPTKEVSDMVMATSWSHDGANSCSDTSGLLRIIATLNNGSSTRPQNLNREERILWDALQTAMVNDRNEHLTKRRNLERSLQESTIKLTQVTARETELELELAKSKCECADLEHKYTLALAKNARATGGSNGQDCKDDGVSSENNNTNNNHYEKRIESLELKLQEKQRELQQQIKDHNAEVRAIQRVLADITSDKMKLEDHLAQMEKQKPQEEKKEDEGDYSDTKIKEGTTTSSSSGISKNGADASPETDSKDMVEELNRQLNEAQTHASTIMEEKKLLESEIDAVRIIADNQTKEVQELKVKIDEFLNETVSLKKENEELREQLEQLSSISPSSADGDDDNDNQAESPKPEMDHPKPDQSKSEEGEKEDEVSSPEPDHDEIQILKKSLAETESSLENAKKIIASLENANGSLTLDLRSKLKLKEEELSVVQKESDERKRRLDSLAMELRDLQRRQGDVEEKSQRTKAQLAQQKALVEHLQTSMSDLQSAIVVHEASVSVETGVADRCSIEEISEILADTLNAVKVTLESTEELIEETDDVSVGVADGEVNSEVGRHIDAIIRSDREAAAKELRAQLDQKRIAVKRLEEALRKQHEEMKRMRAQLIGQNSGHGDNDEQLRAEVLSLRQQCSTNLEVLAKKERELSVLRSSLKVDDNDAGYISDDASDDEDDTVPGEKTMPAPTDLDSYGPAEAEAYATILSQTSGSVAVTGRKRDVEALKIQLLKALDEKDAASKELKAEQESLANAKMIISSLEKANKGMMEDLRSRLQDSNTAIAALLDKSMEHEKIAEKYRQEVEKLNLVTQQEHEKYEDEIKKLREQLMTQGHVRCNPLVSQESVDAPKEEKKEEVLFADI